MKIKRTNKLKKTLLLLTSAYMLNLMPGYGQTMPEPYKLQFDEYKLFGFSSATPAGEYPPNMIFWQTKEKDPLQDSEMNGNWVLPYDLTSKSRINALDSLGILFRNTSQKNLPDGEFLGEAVLALNTEYCCNIRVKWTGRTIVKGERKYSVALQYKVGELEEFKDLGSVYNASETENDFLLLPEVTLPEYTTHKKKVYLRWKYYYTGAGEGERPGIAIDDIQVLFDPFCSVEDAKEIELNVFPNPSDGKFSVNFDGVGGKKYFISIVDLSGNKIYSKEYFANQGANKINIPNNNLETGIYFLHIKQEEKLYIQKIIIQK
jgi:hypothetical protein